MHISTRCNSSMKPHQNSSSFSSLQQLLEELENLIFLEFSGKGNPWISVAKLSRLFHKKYGVSLEYIVQAQGYGHSFRSFFKNSRCFSIYGTPVAQEFYVALLQVVVPNYDQNQTRPIQYRIKRPPRILKAESAKEIPFRQVQRISGYQPVLVPEIKSVDDLEIMLVEIIKSLTINLSKQFATVATLSKKFRDHYGQPIQSVMRSVCPDMKLIDLLQTIPNLHVQEVDDDWQINLEVD
jgi:hypothetical protein